MSDSRVSVPCPRCGRAVPAQAPQGLCPACLVASLFDPLTADPDEVPLEMPLPASAAERVGPYELLEQIGRGGMGVVFRALDTRLHRIVALKLILTGRLASNAEVKRFRAEAEAAAHLEHPHIVPIYEVGESDDGRHFFAMKLVEGGSLANRGESPSPSPQPATGPRPPAPDSPQAIARFVATIARAVHHAHQRGILHRDLKPANILLDPTGDPMVTDFGLARRIDDDRQLTMSGTVLGSPSYMAPEQMRGRPGEVTVAADIYSLGAILYELLDGRPPFIGETALDIMRQGLEREPVPPGTRSGRRVDRDLSTICLKCLEKTPARRYATAADLADDLDRWTRREPILARPGTAIGRLWKWTRRHPAAAALGIVCGFALAGFILLEKFNQRLLTEQRDKAQSQERIARDTERTTRLNLYAADMYLAARALDQGNLALARRTLAAHIPATNSSAEDLRGFEWRHYWMKAQGQQERVLAGFSNAVNCVAFSPDGRWLAAGGGNLVQKWRLPEFKLVAAFRHEPKAIVHSLAFSPDGSSIWAGETRGQIRVWVDGFTRPMGEITRGTGWVNIVVPAKPTTTLAISERNGTDGGAHGSVALYGFMDFLRRNERGALLPDSGGLAAFSHDGQWLLTGGGTDRLLRHNLKSGLSSPVPGSSALLMTLAMSPDGRHAATSPDNGTGITLYEFRGADVSVATVNLDWRCRALAFAPDGQMLAAASYDHTVRLLNAASGFQTHRLDGHTDQVQAVAFSPDGQALASASRDGTVRIWSLAGIHRDGLRGVHPPFALSSDGGTLWAGSADDWESTLTRRDLQNPDATPEPVLRFRADRFPGLSRCNNGLIGWFVRGATPPEPWARFEEFVGRDTNRVVWRRSPAGSANPGDRVASHVKGVSACAANGRVLAMADRGKVRLWDNFAAARLPNPRPSPHDTRRMALSDDGRLLAISAGLSNVVSVWDTATGASRFQRPARATPVNDLVFSPDGAVLAVAGDDATIQLLETDGGRVRATLTGHEVGLAAVAFSPDGRTLASTAGAWLKLWHLPTLREVGSLQTGGDNLAFSPDGTLLLSTFRNGDARLLRAPRADRQPLRPPSY